MLEAIKYIIHIIREEAKRRGWFGIIKALSWLAGWIGFSVIALHPLLKWLFPQSVVAAWAILISSAVVVTLLIAINFMRTYHERMTKEALEEWKWRRDVLEELYRYVEYGKELAEKCKQSEPVPTLDVRRWSGGAAHHLEKIGIEYRRRFFEHSDTGEGVPDSHPDCRNWIETRIVKIQQVIAELKQPPPQLIPHKVKNRIESDITKYLVK